MGKVMMVANSPAARSTEDTATTLAESRVLAEKWHGYDNNRLLYAFTPRFAVSAQRRVDGRRQRACVHNSPGSFIHTHLAESMEEVQFGRSPISASGAQLSRRLCPGQNAWPTLDLRSCPSI